MKNFKAILHNRTFYGLLALTLLVVGVGGYVLLANRPAADTMLLPEPSGQVSAPVQQVPAVPEIAEETTTPPAEQSPEAQPKEVPVSKPAFIPDDTPVIVSPPKVVVAPLEGEVITAFSVDRLVYNETLEDWRTHDGVDIAATLGEVVLAASAGTVASVEDDPFMGTTVIIDHTDGCRTTYANLQPDPVVAAGDKVAAGQTIGAVGETASAEASQGAHLHFSVSKDGVPMDPAKYLN